MGFVLFAIFASFLFFPFVRQYSLLLLFLGGLWWAASISPAAHLIVGAVVVMCLASLPVIGFVSAWRRHHRCP